MNPAQKRNSKRRNKQTEKYWMLRRNRRSFVTFHIISQVVQAVLFEAVHSFKPPNQRDEKLCQKNQQNNYKQRKDKTQKTLGYMK